ncbi:hypothetical protein B0H13DRAFT_1882311 [Mycena leptocephala]|nr:hypothetical protein B0H13DRAFT_1882311 [Mycena leptocephala]
MSGCNIVTNADISGLGVRISLYLQSLITIIFIRLSPGNATTSWWVMSTTSIGLAVASFATGAKRSISLVDGIIASHLLLLPLTAATYSEFRLIERRLAVSPLLVIIGFIRGALISVFGLWIWGSSPSFGSIPECNDLINLFVFRPIRATSATARGIGLAFWGAYTLVFCVGNLQRSDTLIAAIQALFSKLEAAAFRLPRKTGPGNKIVQNSGYIGVSVAIHPIIQWLISRWTQQKQWNWSQQAVLERRPTRDFHAPELDLTAGNKNIQQDFAFGFSQILPLSLTILPVLSLLDWYSRPVEGQLSKFRSVRLAIKGMRGQMTRESGALRDCFVLVSIEETNQLFTTLVAPHAEEPRWNESFDISVSELSNVLIEIFDTLTDGEATCCGYAVITPLHISGYDLLNASGEISTWVPIRMNGSFGTPTLEIGLILDPTGPALDALMAESIRNRSGTTTRLTTYHTFSFPPIIPVFTCVYRIESVTEHFILSKNHAADVSPPPASHSSPAYAYWVSTFFGTICVESSPKRLPDRVSLGTSASIWSFSVDFEEGMKRAWLPDGSLELPFRTGHDWANAFFADICPVKIFRSGRENHMISITRFGVGIVKTETM